MKRVFAIAVIVTLVGFLESNEPASAHHAEYQYKFPCYFPDTCYVTWLSHGSGNALDFDPQGSAGLAPIPAMAEGDVTFTSNTVTTCTWPGAHGYGIHSIVTDIHGRSTIYAHLSSLSATSGLLFQGDQVGVEGNTGYSEDCQAHLHWEPGNLPTYINGLAVAGLTAGPTNYGGSAGANTNSRIGTFNTPGNTLRNYYRDSGRWDDLGWTHKHCGSGAPCELAMFANKAWGWMQDFRVHPNPLTQEEFHTIQVAEWDQGDAFLADTVFWAKWAQGGLTSNATPPRRPLSIALQERQTTCPAGSRSDCVGYQRFHLGYVWMGSFLGRESIFCPDISDGAPHDPGEYNGNVDLVDVVAILGSFGVLVPWFDVSPEPNPAVDIGDAVTALSEFGETCKPT